jgi:hypothetical protein
MKVFPKGRPPMQHAPVKESRAQVVHGQAPLNLLRMELGKQESLGEFPEMLGQVSAILWMVRLIVGDIICAVRIRVIPIFLLPLPRSVRDDGEAIQRRASSKPSWRNASRYSLLYLEGLLLALHHFVEEWNVIPSALRVDVWVGRPQTGGRRLGFHRIRIHVN